MPKQLLILKVIFWIFGILVCLAGAMLTFSYAGHLSSADGIDTILSLLRLLGRMLIGAFGVLLLLTALAMASRKTWVWDLAMTSAAICISTVVLGPIGIYAIRVLLRRDVNKYYGRYH